MSKPSKLDEARTALGRKGVETEIEGGRDRTAIRHVIAHCREQEADQDEHRKQHQEDANRLRVMKAELQERWDVLAERVELIADALGKQVGVDNPITVVAMKKEARKRLESKQIADLFGDEPRHSVKKGKGNGQIPRPDDMSG